MIKLNSTLMMEKQIKFRNILFNQIMNWNGNKNQLIEIC